MSHALASLTLLLYRLSMWFNDFLRGAIIRLHVEDCAYRLVRYSRRVFVISKARG